MFFKEEWIHQDQFQEIIDEKDREIHLLKEVVESLEIDIDHMSRQLDQLRCFVSGD
jgi:signal transduction protein with GAF and PtsI domain